MPRVGVVLSGCGVFDGSEIHEAVLTLLALDRQGADAVCMAPDIPQASVVNHLSGKPVEGETRHVLAESARIARGKVRDLAGVHASDLDAIVFPGGFGAAKNLSTFASDGSSCEVHPDVARIVREMHGAGKPVCGVCIAPVVLARVLGGDGVPVEVTVGDDPGTAGAIRSAGAVHVDCAARDCVVDEKHKIVTTPAYMLARRISEVADGVDAAVRALLKLVH